MPVSLISTLLPASAESNGSERMTKTLDYSGRLSKAGAHSRINCTMVLAKPAIGAAWRFLPLSRWPLQLAELKDLCIVQLRRKANIKQTVVSNLLLNAADAMAGIEGRPRTLRVQTEIQGTDSVKLLVRDSGVG